MSRVLLMLAGGMMVCGGGACTAPNPNRPIDASVDAPKNHEIPDAPTPDALLPDAKPLPDGYMCTANAFLRCEGDTAVSCNAAGDGEDRQQCALGCDEAKMRCNDIAPSNDLGTYLDMTERGQDVSIPNGSVIDTDSGMITDASGNLVNVPSDVQPGGVGGVDIRVFIVHSLVIDDVIVRGAHAVAFVSDGDVLVRGVIDVDAGQLSEPACLGDRGTVCRDLSGTPGDGDDVVCPGWGGSGFGSRGGAGGDYEARDQVGGKGGLIVGDESLEPLRGGCGDNPSDDRPTGGGAIQIVSRTRIEIASGGWIDVNGLGGDAFKGIFGETQARGGGSGGGVLLEAPSVVVASAGAITANGGGGAAECGDGSPGQRSEAQAAGANCQADGGSGAALAGAATDGESVLVETTDSAGAGGGGFGRIRVNTAEQFSPDTGAILSPAPSSGLIATR